MNWTTAAIDILLVLYVLVCGLMCLVVLMQRSKQEGLGAAFGGGFTESVWGAQTSQVLVKATVFLAAGFFVISILLARLYTHRTAMLEQKSSLQQELLRPVPLPATNAAGTPLVPTATPLVPAVANPPAQAPVSTNTVAPAAPVKK